VLFICASLAFTVEKGERKRGLIFYIGIFVLNGMAGVISKLFSASDFPKTSAADYLIWIAIFTIAFSGLVWVLLSCFGKRDEKTIRPSKGVLFQTYALGALNGALNKVANFLLVLAIAKVDASVQYPMVTGGTIIISTILCFFGDKKPSKKEIISVILAFIGMLFLFLLPV
jgi:drug/metabolite transporter (DMT)-like permease